MSTKARGKLTLERVLGLSTCSNAGLSVNLATGDVAYPAGCVVVMYNFQRDKQTRYYRVEKPVSAIAFSIDGTLLAIAEKGQAPSITVWDVETGQLKAEFKRHKYGVIAMAFSADSRFLVSVGLIHDKMLYAWDLSTNAVVGGAVIDDKIHAVDFSVDGRFFVTVGHRHVHFWPLDKDNMFRVTGNVVADPPLVELASVPATMSRLADATFVDVGCGASNKTVALTADGFLCCFGGTVMERLVSLEASRGLAMSVSADIVAVAGAASTIRMFDPITLEYKQTLPFPPPHGRMNESNQFSAAFLTPPRPDEYAAAVAVRVVGTTHVIAVYADHTLVVFERPTGKVLRTFFFHHGPVTDLQVVGHVVGLDARNRPQVSRTSAAPEGTFVTCSDDKTVRFWHLDRHRKQPTPTTWINPYCPELLHVVYTSKPPSPAIPSKADNQDMSPPLQPVVPDMHNPKETADTPDGLKCLAVADHTIAVGANDGAIHVVQLDWPFMPQQVLDKAHASAVLTVAYSPRGDLLASGGRDRLTHVHDAAHIRTKTLENHSGAVVAAEFTADGKRLISAGADHNLVFTQVSDHRIFRYNSFPVQGGKLHAMAVVDNDYILTCVNTWVDVHTLISNKHVQTHHVGEHHRVALSPGAALVALGGSTHDKTIHVVDFHSGEVLAKAAGHGDAVTGLKFTLDGRRLLSSSNDGCIFVWRLSDDLQSALKAKLRPVGHVSLEPPPAPPIAPKPPLPAAVAPSEVEKTEPSHAAGAPPPPPPLMPPPPPTSKLPLPNKPQPPPVKPPAVNAAVENELNEWLAARNHQNNVLATKVEEVLAPVEKPAPDDGGAAALLNKELVPSWARTFRQLEGPTEEANASVGDGGGRHAAAGGKWAAHATPDPLTVNKPQEPAAHTTPVPLSKAADLVPNWARTIRQPKSPRKTSKEVDAPPSVGKWGAHGVVDSIALCDGASSGDDDDDDDDELEMSETLYIKQSNGELHQVEVPLKPAALLPSSSWSLAHERDLLNKKKKQQETANAVADMQAKLGLLGILKPKPKPVVAPGDAALDLAKSPVHASIVAGYAAELAHETKASQANAERKSAIDPPTAPTTAPPPVAVSQSLDLSAQTQSLSHFVGGFDKLPPPVNHSVDATPVDISLSHFVSGYADATTTPTVKKPTASVDQSLDVTASLSHFVSGYEKRPSSGAVAASSGATSDGTTVQLSVDFTPVDVSLSQFTSGYDRPLPSAPPLAPPATSVQHSVDLTTPVDVSLSHFVTGFHAQAAGTKSTPPPPPATPSVQASADLTPVDMSLSHFVSGFHGQTPSAAPPTQQSIDLTPVNLSLSHFVSGYDASTQKPVKTSPHAPVTTSQSIDFTPTNVSLSGFVSGFVPASPPPHEPADEPPHESATPAPSATTTLVAASVDLTPVDASLGQFVGGYANAVVPRGAADAKPLAASDNDLVRASADTVSEPSVSSSLDDEGDVDAISQRSLSQYVSGYSARGEATSMGQDEAKATTQAASSILEDESLKMIDDPSSVKDSSGASQTTAEGMRPPSLAVEVASTPTTEQATSSSVDSSSGHAPADVKPIVRSLRHLEVNLETTVRQLDAVRPGQDADVDEIVALAATLMAKIANYADKARDR